jgi:hypothetical protein
MDCICAADFNLPFSRLKLPSAGLCIFDTAKRFLGHQDFGNQMVHHLRLRAGVLRPKMAHRGGDGLRAGPHAADIINGPCTCTFVHAWASHTVIRHHHPPSRRWMRTHKSPLPPDDKREATASPTGNCHSHSQVTKKDLAVDLSSPIISERSGVPPQSKSDFSLFPRTKGFGAGTHSQCFSRPKNHL